MRSPADIIDTLARREPRLLPHRLLWPALVASESWGPASSALTAALTDPDVDEWAPRCVYHAAALTFEEFSFPAHALHYMAAEIWRQSEARH